MRPTRKFRLLVRLDEIIADLRDATAAIQRDDYAAADEKFSSASDGVKAAADELKAAA